MIRYDLECSHGHAFDAWFSDSASFDEQLKARLVTCPLCGDAQVRKQLMRPAIPARAPRSGDEIGQNPATDPNAKALREMVREIHALVKTRADYVGTDFASEARRRHKEGVKLERGIWGEATAEDAHELVEEGIDIVPLPPLPDDKN